MVEEDKNPAAVELGRRGGREIAKRGPEYFAELQAKRQVRAGGRPKNPLEATHVGQIEIGELKIPCAVLADGTRVLSQRGVGRALGRKHGGQDWRRRAGGELPVFLGAENLKPFISEELALVVSKPILYRNLRGGGVAHGIEATALPTICEVWLKARDAGALKAAQLPVAIKADILTRGLAHTGIVALVDEATGYQVIRDRQALQAILDRFLRKELAAWAKRFPDEFYQQMFRLRGWEWKGMKINRPQVVGHYTNDLVYERLAPNILEELQERNPKNLRGQRDAKHHQWLTEDVGHPALAQHLYALIGMMRASSKWKQFYDLVQRAFPKKGETLFLPLHEDEA
ncbi:MAG: P63C domain-containing protein [Bryobacteraceae bacterium]|jgi:hypothetical protein